MHVPVLLKEIVEILAPKIGDSVVDATLGAGGHARALGEKIGNTGILVGIDEDERAVKTAEEKLKNALSCTLCFQSSNFRDIDAALQRCGITQADIIFFDLGLSSTQLEQSGRGFSFRTQDPLLMTFSARPVEGALTAYEIINYWDEKRIAQILYEYGEENRARAIAGAIVKARDEKPIGYAHELAALVEMAVPQRRGNHYIHPATKTFQALRIAVNDELNTLSLGLEKGLVHLKSGGRMGVISFHSLEDRIVKQFFKSQEKVGTISILTKKPIIPSRAEIAENGRARSAKFRAAQKL